MLNLKLRQLYLPSTCVLSGSESCIVVQAEALKLIEAVKPRVEIMTFLL